MIAMATRVARESMAVPQLEAVLRDRSTGDLSAFASLASHAMGTTMRRYLPDALLSVAERSGVLAAERLTRGVRAAVDYRAAWPDADGNDDHGRGEGGGDVSSVGQDLLARSSDGAEHAVTLGKDGTEVGRASGKVGEDSVDLPDRQNPAYKDPDAGLQHHHNHPYDASFSTGDVMAFAANPGISHAYVHTSDATYKMERVPGVSERDLHYATRDVFAEHHRAVIDKVIAGELDQKAGKAASAASQHHAMIELDRRRLIKYSAQRKKVRAAVAVKFDATNPRARAWAADRSARLIQEISDETEAQIRAEVARAFDEHRPPVESARQIKQMIGLTQDHADAVSRFRDEVLASPGEIVSVGSGSTEREVRVPEDVDEEFADEAAGEYADDLLDWRADNIARTETIAASNEGQEELWRQALEDGLLPEGVGRVWIVSDDERLCPQCSSLDGMVAAIGEAFESSEGPVDMPPAHPQCRCTLGLSLVEADQASLETLRRLQAWQGRMRVLWPDSEGNDDHGREMTEEIAQQIKDADPTSRELVPTPFPLHDDVRGSKTLKPEIREISLADVVGSRVVQREVYVGRVKQYVDKPSKKAVKVVETRPGSGKYQMIDGHHRAVAGVVRGDKTIKAQVTPAFSDEERAKERAKYPNWGKDPKTLELRAAWPDSEGNDDHGRGEGGGGEVAKAFESASTEAASSKESKAWVKANQARYDSDPEFKAIVDAATLFTQGKYRELYIVSAAEDGHDPKVLAAKAGFNEEYVIGKLLSGEEKLAGGYEDFKSFFKGQDMANPDRKGGSYLDGGRALNKALASAPKIEGDMHRGLFGRGAFNAFSEVKAGDDFDIKGATSFTVDKDIAEKFATGRGPGQHVTDENINNRVSTTFIIRGGRGLKVGALSPYKQREVITKGKFKVVSNHSAYGEGAVHPRDRRVITLEPRE